MSRKSRAKPPSPFRYFHSSPELIRQVVMLYIRFPLSLRDVEDLLFERGYDLCHETVRLWWNRFGPSPEAITTDGLKSYGAAMTELGNAGKQEVGRWANNRVENSHLPFRRRERAMLRFRRMKTLQKFSSVHASVHNLFNQERHLVDRHTFKERRSAALAEWRTVMN